MGQGEGFLKELQEFLYIIEGENIGNTTSAWLSRLQTHLNSTSSPYFFPLSSVKGQFCWCSQVPTLLVSGTFQWFVSFPLCSFSSPGFFSSSCIHTQVSPNFKTKTNPSVNLVFPSQLLDVLPCHPSHQKKVNVFSSSLYQFSSHYHLISALVTPLKLFWSRSLNDVQWTLFSLHFSSTLCHLVLTHFHILKILNTPWPKYLASIHSLGNKVLVSYMHRALMEFLVVGRQRCKHVRQADQH